MLRLVAAGAVLLGVALRLWLYLENRSLWLDPAMLALNVIGKDPGQLLQRLDMNQAAPAGFLLASKAVGSLCDYSEYSLRLLPLAFGIAALVFFVGLSVRLLGPVRAPLDTRVAFGARLHLRCEAVLPRGLSRNRHP